ncbi:hypothetical protein SERLADRAFT_401038 [Serpula lacrymans var. lacrymans S7.9]|nr:uncharacterized protein SERLADRAFT_401038 [Serpula lacrymans var. lacrymans S7.9]EGO19832.1 hypothetical protein SERLADRAFT_401038 [Serpula lacrymans var. lacrymans S7.9]
MSECTKFNAVDPDKAKAAETLEHPCARIPTPTAEVKLEEDIRLAPSSHNTEVTTSVKPSASRNHTLQRTQRPPHHIPIRHSTRLASKSGLLISSIGPDHGLDEENSCDDSFSPVRYLKSGRRQTKKVPQRVWCSSCGLNFTREADLRRHEETIHSSVSLDEIYSETRERYRIYCNRCRAILGRVDARQRHEKNKSCGRSRMIREAREKNGTISGHLQLKLKAHQSSRPHAASSR